MKRPVLDRAQVDHLAALASLSLTSDEAEAMACELEAIIAYVEELRAVDTSEVSAAQRELSARSALPWREDVLTPGLSHDEALGGAARATEAGFAVPGFVPAGVATTGGSAR